MLAANAILHAQRREDEGCSTLALIDIRINVVETSLYEENSFQELSPRTLLGYTVLL